jgi:hypothetical protein
MLVWKGSGSAWRGDLPVGGREQGRPDVRARFWIELFAAVACGLLAIVTLVVGEWIEVVFGVDPDAGSGTAEWLVVVLLGAGVVVSALLARYELELQRMSMFANEEA